MKLVVIYGPPEDADAFESAYAKHVTLVEKVPGLTETRLTRVKRTMRGDELYMIAELIFPDGDSFKSGMNSAEMAEVGKDARQFANLIGMYSAAEG